MPLAMQETNAEVTVPLAKSSEDAVLMAGAPSAQYAVPAPDTQELIVNAEEGTSDINEAWNTQAVESGNPFRNSYEAFLLRHQGGDSDSDYDDEEDSDDEYSGSESDESDEDSDEE